MATKSSVQSLARLFHTTGERLEALRKEKGYTQGDLAELLGTTKATISRYESNLIDIPRPKLQKLADFLGVSPTFLLCWDQQEEIAELRIKKPDEFSGVSMLPKIDYESLKFGQPYQPAKEREKEDRQEKELISIFRSLSVRGQTQLLSFAYELQDNQKTARNLSSAELSSLVTDIEAAHEPKAVDNATVDHIAEIINQAFSSLEEREKK